MYHFVIVKVFKTDNRGVLGCANYKTLLNPITSLVLRWSQRPIKISRYCRDRSWWPRCAAAGSSSPHHAQNFPPKKSLGHQQLLRSIFCAWAGRVSGDWSVVPCCVLGWARVVQQLTGHHLTIAIWAAVPDVLLLVRQRVMDIGIANQPSSIEISFRDRSVRFSRLSFVTWNWHFIHNHFWNL